MSAAEKNFQFSTVSMIREALNLQNLKMIASGIFVHLYHGLMFVWKKAEACLGHS